MHHGIHHWSFFTTDLRLHVFLTRMKRGSVGVPHFETHTHIRHTQVFFVESNELRNYCVISYIVHTCFLQMRATNTHESQNLAKGPYHTSSFQQASAGEIQICGPALKLSPDTEVEAAQGCRLVSFLVEFAPQESRGFDPF